MDGLGTGVAGVSGVGALVGVAGGDADWRGVARLVVVGPAVVVTAPGPAWSSPPQAIAAAASADMASNITLTDCSILSVSAFAFYLPAQPQASTTGGYSLTGGSMATRLYVGGLSYDTTDDGLREYFSQAGTVTSASVVMDRMSGRSRGFGFVEMEANEDAQKAIRELNGTMLDGRTLTVNEARPQGQRTGGGGGSRGGGGGYGRR